MNRKQNLTKVILSILFSAVIIFTFQNCSRPGIHTAESASTGFTAHSSSALLISNQPKGPSGTAENLWMTPPGKDAAEYQKFLDVSNIGLWDKSFKSFSVYKFYVVNLDPTHPTYIGAAGVAKFIQFSKFIKSQGKKLAVELGGVYAEACVDGPFHKSGLPQIAERGFFYESRLLLKLKEAGIEIDYVVFDGPFIRIFESQHSTCVVKFGSRMSVDFVSSEIVYYMNKMKNIFPKTQFVWLINFPNWDFNSSTSTNGVGARIKLHDGSVLKLENLVAQFLQTLKVANLTLAGVQFDNPYNFIIYQNGTSASGTVSASELEQRWLRLRQLTDLIRAQGFRPSLIINSETHEGETPTNSELALASREFYDFSVEYLSGLQQRSIAIDQFVIQSWYRAPQFILPESQNYSFMNLLARMATMIGIIPSVPASAFVPASAPAPAPASVPASSVPASVPAPARVPASVPVLVPVLVPASVSALVSVPSQVSMPVVFSKHPVYRLFNLTSKDYLNSNSNSEGAPYWNLVGTAFTLFDKAYGQFIPLYRCYNQVTGSHFVSIASGCEGHTSEGILGYASRSPSALTPTALFRCYNSTEARHLMTINPAECQQGGFTIENALGYVE